MKYLQVFGERLVELGYQILPIKPGTKRPDIPDWPRFVTTVEQARKWASNGKAAHGIGINARNTPAIDVDVLDPEVAIRMQKAIAEIFPDATLLTRTGLAPKFLIPFRSDEPFRKLVSKTYTDGTHEHKVEILGDGQQWVAYARHPAGHEYQWGDLVSDDGAANVPHAALPRLDIDSARRVIDAFELLASELLQSGAWRTVSAEVKDAGVLQAGDDFDAFTPPTDLTYAQVSELIHKVSSESRDDWLRIGRMLHHQYGGLNEGLALWNDWSQQSEKYNSEDQDRVWESFGHRNDHPETLRSLIKEFGQPAAPVKEADTSRIVKAATFADAPPISWWVKGVMPKQALTVIYGAPGSSKSFFALDVVAHISEGEPWNGKKTKQTNVLYIAAEGAVGFRSRVKAYMQAHDTRLENLFVWPETLELNGNGAAIAHEAEKLGCGVVVIDTLAAVTPGEDENSSEGMGAAIAQANAIIATGASVILIHHSNKIGELRGWSGLLGAADNTIKVTKKASHREASVEKMKDGPDDGKYQYTLQSVQLGVDEDGDAITSCVLAPAEVEDEEAEEPKRPGGRGNFWTSGNTAKTRAYLGYLQDCAGPDNRPVHYSDFVTHVRSLEEENMFRDPEKPSERTIKKHLELLADEGIIAKNGEMLTMR